MDLHNKKILMAAQYAAPYMGNFILSLICLESKIKEEYNAETAYVFPENVADREWYRTFALEHTCFLTDACMRRSEQKIKDILLNYAPDIVHTHFDGYDVPVSKAMKQVNAENIKVIWHLHDHLGYVSNIFKKAYQFYRYVLHYSYFAKNVSTIAVCDEVRRFTNMFHRVLRFNEFKNNTTIPNGIDLTRLCRSSITCGSDCCVRDGGGYKFLVLAGRNSPKRADLLLKAGVLLNHRGIGDFQILLVEGVDTDEVVGSVFGNSVPSWLRILPQNHNISEIFSQADCFVSTSVAETFSYAICEASIWGLPVIQSDIEGTLWNSSNPSTFLFSSGNVEELADTMQYVMNIPRSEMKRLCAITRENNKSKYSIETWCENIIDFYKTL